MSKHKHKRHPVPKQATPIKVEETRPDWTRKCENCGATPIVPVTGMCGPCTFGEAETAGGNW
jgi:CO dehydrogenase/acetyl-CoA synthase alpha subunit